MLSQNPFATAAPLVSAGFLKTFLAVMILAVIVGTVFDMIHKGSAAYFFGNMRRNKARQKRELGGGELLSIAVQTAVVDEHCEIRRTARVGAVPAAQLARDEDLVLVGRGSVVESPVEAGARLEPGTTV